MRILPLALGGLLCVGLALGAAEERVEPRGEGWEEAKRRLLEGNPAAAKRLAEAMIARGSTAPDLHVLAGIASLKLREPQNAELHLRKALRLEPGHVEARTLLAWIEMEIRGEYGAAVIDYRKVIELKPDSPEAHNNLGVALRKAGDAEAAIEAFGQAIGLRRDFSEAWSNRGWALVELKRWREAEKDFERAVELNPGDDGALYGLARARRETRDYAGAGRALRTLMARSPNFIYWLEWGQIQMVRYYWVLLLVAGGAFVRFRYLRGRLRRHVNGR